MKIIVLGAGMIGRTIAKDLAVSHEVTSVDRDPRSLELLEGVEGIKTLRSNLNSFSTYKSLLAGFDLCVCAVPGFMGYETLECIIKTGTNVVDISFSPENVLELHELAVKNKVTAIVDCGVAPGMSNLILGYYSTQMNIQKFECLVGGLPKEKKAPWDYKAPFSPIDVIEEYSRPARIKENGNIVVRAALSEPELIEFKEVGVLESFNTDGLRSILINFPDIPNMKEKTLRYPGHIALIQALQQSGFFTNEKIMIDGTAISRKDFTCKVLFDQWKLLPTDREFTIMKINIEGIADNEHRSVQYFLFDEYDEATQTSSMSRTTAFSCTASVDLICKNLFSEKGVYAPETVGKDEACFTHVMAYLEKRGVYYKKTES